MRKVCESLEEANKVLQQQLKILQDQQKQILLKEECHEEMIEEEVKTQIFPDRYSFPMSSIGLL